LGGRTFKEGGGKLTEEYAYYLLERTPEMKMTGKAVTTNKTAPGLPLLVGKVITKTRHLASRSVGKKPSLSNHDDLLS